MKKEVKVCIPEFNCYTVIAEGNNIEELREDAMATVMRRPDMIIDEVLGWDGIDSVKPYFEIEEEKFFVEKGKE
jgi:hypothetical protein